MNTLPILNCDDCGICCTYTHTTPHRIRWEDGQPQPRGSDAADDTDCELMLAAPSDARQLAYQAALQQNETDEPCAWFDAATGRCRFHEFRPRTCREFEAGGEWCRLLRKIMLPETTALSQT